MTLQALFDRLLIANQVDSIDWFDLVALQCEVERHCLEAMRHGVSEPACGLSVRAMLGTVGRLLAAGEPAGELLTIDEAARVLGCSPSGLRKLVARRAIQYSQPRKHAPIRFRRQWLDEYVAAGSVEVGAPATRKRQPAKFGFDPFS